MQLHDLMKIMLQLKLLQFALRDHNKVRDDDLFI